MSSRSRYLVWSHRPVGNGCMLCPPEGIERDWELNEGVPRATDFPEDAVLRMSDDHPRAIALNDNPMNLSGLPIVSERLRDALVARDLRNVEYLPVRILDHRGRTADDHYFIVNPTQPQDCLDAAASVPRMSPISPPDIVGVDELVIDESRVDPGLRLFRIRDFWDPVLVRRDLADALAAQRFVGLTFAELEDYGS